MKRLMLYILSLVWVVPVLAQDFNPDPPADPYTKYKVTTSATPYGYTSGEGFYMSDESVWISTSSYGENYTFNHWNKNGVYYTDESSFEYTVEAQTTHFEAVYDYTPVIPNDPQYTNKYKLYLTNNVSSACSFNMTSGSSYESDVYVYVEAYASAAYDFLGWYENGVKISDALAFNYLMPENNVTLTARFSYNPQLPDDPSSSTDDAQNIAVGDIDGTGVVNVSDAVDLITSYLNNTTSELSKGIADVDNNGVINVSDAVEIIQIYLNNK